MFFRMREIKIHKHTFLAFVTLAKRQVDRNGQSSQMLGYLIGYELQEENYCVGTEFVLPKQNSHLQSTVLKGMYVCRNYSIIKISSVNCSSYFEPTCGHFLRTHVNTFYGLFAKLVQSKDFIN